MTKEELSKLTDLELDARMGELMGDKPWPMIESYGRCIPSARVGWHPATSLSDTLSVIEKLTERKGPRSKQFSFSMGRRGAGKNPGIYTALFIRHRISRRGACKGRARAFAWSDHSASRAICLAGLLAKLNISF